MAKNLGSLDQPQMGYTFDKGVVYYNAGTSLSAANLKTGKTKWSYKSTPSSAPITNLGYVYFTDTSGRIHKVNAKTGKSAWVKKHMPRQRAERDMNRVASTTIAVC